MTARRLLAALALALALAAPREAAAQPREITIRGDDQTMAARVAREILARNDYLLLDRDTVLPDTFRTDRDVVVLSADVRLAGTIDGEVAVIGGHFFLRPGSRVTGQVAIVGGGFYPSARAEYGDVWESATSTAVGVEAVAGPADGPSYAVEVTGPPRPRAISFGPRLPTYDRVDGLTLAAGMDWNVLRREGGPTAGAWASYRFARAEWGGGFAVAVPLGVQQLRLVGEASRETRTNDEWIRSDIFNSLSVAAAGRDFRDYWESDLAEVSVVRVQTVPLIAGETWLGPRAGARFWRDRPLATDDDVWSLFQPDESLRANPAVDSGTVVSAFAGAELRLVGRTSRLVADVEVEHAFPGWEGDFEFTHGVGQAYYEATLPRGHELSLYVRGTATLGGDPAPPQRFGILGGAGTLPTVDIATFRGDRMVYASAFYAIPTPLRIKYLGTAYVEASYSTGTAWVTGTPMPDWVQNPGLGLRFPFLRARVVIDPAQEKIEPTFDFGLTLARM